MLIRKNIGNLSLLLKISRSYHNLYDVLGVENGASQQEIKAKYYQLAKKYHPDTQEYTKDPNRFIKIKEAYQTLGDQEKRKQYDNNFYSSQKTNDTHSDYGAYQNSYQSYQAKYSDYSSRYRKRKTQQQDSPTFFTLLRRSKLSVLFWGAYLYMALQVFNYLQKRMDQNDREFQQAIIRTSPSVIERRKKLYEKQMKEKGIYAHVVDLKYRVLTKESTRAKLKRTQSLISIQGIQKEKKQQVPQLAVKPEYM